MNIGTITSNNFNLDSNGKDMQIEVYEQLIEQLQQENKKLNGAIQTYNILLKSNVEENKQLKERIEYLERGVEEYQKALDETMSEKIDIENNWNKLKKDLELVVDYGLGDESSKWDKIYGEYAKSTLKFMQELEQGSDNK